MALLALDIMAHVIAIPYREDDERWLQPILVFGPCIAALLIAGAILNAGPVEVLAWMSDEVERLLQL